MTDARPWSALAAILPALGVCACRSAEDTPSSSQGIDCSLQGCGANATMELLFSDERELDSSIARVCRNDTCVDGALPRLPPSPDHGRGDVLRGALIAHVAVYREASGFRVEASTIEDSHLFVDSDIYALSVSAPGGAPTTTGRWSARYREIFPDGACSSLCLKADLEPIAPP